MIYFEKMQAMGNDFIFIKEADCEYKDYSELAKTLCKRYFKIGADGLVVVHKDPLEMKIFNQDGSKAEMCGNAMRCFITLIKKWKWENSDSFEIICNEEKYQCMYKENQNSVFFPSVSYQLNGLKNNENESVGKELNVYGVHVPCTIVKAGCLHTIVFDDLDLYRNIAFDISNHPLFKAGCNVDFVQILSENRIKVITYERGVGFTKSCGSGNVASAYVAKNLYQLKKQIQVINDGGRCEVTVEDGGAWISGTCENVFSGMINIE